MYIPKFFLRDMKNIDPKLYVVKDESLGMYDIRKRVEVVRKNRFGTTRYIEDRLIDSFMEPNDDALAQLRYRKWLGNKFETEKDPTKYLKWMKDQEREIKKKKIEYARELQAHGWVRLYNHIQGKRRMFT